MSVVVRGRAWIIAAALALLALLGGCSALRLAYGQAPELVYWWLDGYVDFDTEQSGRARAALAEYFAWHRATQLRDYADLLAAVRTRGLDDVDARLACTWADEARRRLERAFERALPPVADMALRLKPEQVQHIERRYQKANDEFRRDYLQSVPADRAAAALKRTVERAESFYGPLDERQRQLLAEGVSASPFDPDLWLAERMALQQGTLQVLRRVVAERPAPAEVQAALRTLGAQGPQSPRPAYREYQQRLTAYNCALGAQLHNATTPAQRRRAADKLKGWEDDLRALAQATP